MITKKMFAVSLLFCTSTLSSTLALSQTTTLQSLIGFRHDGPGKVLDSNATFALGVSKDNGATYVAAAGATDNLLIRGEVRPEAAQVGQIGDVFFVDRNLDTGEFRMRTKDGAWVTWNSTVATLQPFLDDVALTSTLSATLFTGSLGTGNHRLFIGYRPADNVLRYHTSGLPLTVTQQTQSPREQALSLFNSAISPNIIGTRCISCHVEGGAAQGFALHIFKTPLAANVQANFDIFRNLVAVRGVTHVMTKVTGGLAHGGGVQLTAGSADYNTLNTFVNLLAQDIAQNGGGSGGGNQTQDPIPGPYDNPY